MPDNSNNAAPMAIRHWTRPEKMGPAEGEPPEWPRAAALSSLSTAVTHRLSRKADGKSTRTPVMTNADATPSVYILNAYDARDPESIRSRVGSIQEEQKPNVLRTMAMRAPKAGGHPGGLYEPGRFEYEPNLVKGTHTAGGFMEPDTF